MAYRSTSPFSAHGEQEISPFNPAYDRSGRLSRRMYNLVMGGLVLLGFVVMAFCGMLATSPAFLAAIYENYFTVMIGSTVASFAGVFVMSAGMRREGVGLPLLGYALIVCSLGFTTGLVLPYYGLPTVVNALVGTVLIAALFTLLGATYPQVFARVQGVAMVSLLALIIVQAVGSLMGAAMTWLDYVVILVFCAFIGRDTYVAQQCEPTVKMAIMNAVNIWLDLLNVFVRILSILGDRD